MSKKLKPLTIFLSDDELVNFKSHFDEFLNMNCDDKIKEQQEEIERLNNIINELEKYLEKIIINGGTRGSMTFWYRQIYDYLQELKGSDKE